MAVRIGSPSPSTAQADAAPQQQGEGLGAELLHGVERAGEDAVRYGVVEPVHAMSSAVGWLEHAPGIGGAVSAAAAVGTNLRFQASEFVVRRAEHVHDDVTGNHPTAVDAQGVHANPTLPGGAHYVADTTPLFGPDGPQMTDVHQGNVNDCQTLSPLAAMAQQDPAYIENHIHDNGDGTVTVDIDGQHVTVSRELPVTSDGSALADSGSNSTDSKPFGDSSWVEYYEKAWLAISTGSYTVTNSWQAEDFTPALTGTTPKAVPTPDSPDAIAARLHQDLASGKMPCVASNFSDSDGALQHLGILPTNHGSEMDDLGIVSDHVYAVQSVTKDDAGNWQIQLYNPWGSNQPPPLTPQQFVDCFYDVEEQGSVFATQQSFASTFAP